MSYKKEYVNMATALVSDTKSGWGEYYREPIFVESNGGIRQIITMAIKEDGVLLLLACTQVIMSTELPVILNAILTSIGHNAFFCMFDLLDRENVRIFNWDGDYHEQQFDSLKET